jgi:hypothetical protein
MTVAFKELSGSPSEKYTEDGFTAQREFLIAWEYRDAFAIEVLGQSAEYGGSTWVNYPGKASVYAFHLEYSPLDPESVDQKTLADLTDGLNSYSNSFAKAVVKYKTVSSQDREDEPEVDPSTHLAYRMAYALDSQPLPATGWRWVDQPSAVLPDAIELVKAVPITEHHLTWKQVVGPPWEAIRQLQGTLNAAEFLSCPRGTMLFAGVEASKLYRSDSDASAPEFCWDIHYVFRERSIKYGGAVYGWNAAYRADPPGWVELTNGSRGLYDLADFSDLFRSTIE